MELVAAFAIGWLIGAKGGEDGYQEVVAATRELRRSEEYQALTQAVRSHLASSLRAVADILSEAEPPVTAGSVVERVVRLTRRGEATSTAS